MAIKEDGSVVFEGAEQEALNKIVEERLARERSKYQGYDDYKGIEEELKSLGYQGTPSEIRAEIKRQREEAARQQELNDLKQQADEDGITPALAKKIKDLESKLEESQNKLSAIESERTAKIVAEEQRKTAEEEYKKQSKELTDKYGEGIIDELSKDEDFIEYAEGKAGTLLQRYEKYLKWQEKHDISTAKRVMSKEMRSTSGGKGTNSGGSYGLTSDQKAEVDKWNAKNSNNPRMQMSYKEYAERLAQNS